jgi:cell division protein DivIC
MHAKTASTVFEKHCLNHRAHLYLVAFLRVNLSKFINGLFIVLFIGITLWAVTFFVQMQRELKSLQAQEQANQRRLAESEAKLKAQEKYLDRLKHDPVLVEQLIRQKMAYAKPDEFIFRFEEVKP